MRTTADPARIASDLRIVLGRLVRRLRAEHRLPLSHGMVLGRLDREGSQSVSDLAHAEGVRPQSMAQTVSDLESAGHITRRPDPHDRRRALVELTAEGESALAAERRLREGWLSDAIANEMTAEERELLGESLVLLRRLAEH